jgi:hypothetical protein
VAGSIWWGYNQLQASVTVLAQAIDTRTGTKFPEPVRWLEQILGCTPYSSLGASPGRHVSHLRDECLSNCYTPPPYTNARLLSVGRFHLGFPQYTRGTGAFCVCHGVVMDGARYGQFDSFLPSVLCKETPTLSPQHTHNTLCDNDLCVCRFFEFARPLGGAVHMVLPV